jgi:hypothetical protein
MISILTKTLYRLFKRFPSLLHAAEDATRQLYYERLDEQFSSEFRDEPLPESVTSVSYHNDSHHNQGHMYLDEI